MQTLLHIYFRHQTLGQTGCLAVVGPSRDFSQASARLMELNLQIREALCQAQTPRTPTRRASCPQPPRPTSRRKSTRKTQSSALDCESFTSLTFFLRGGGFGDFSRRLHFKGLKNVWILVTTRNYYAHTMSFPFLQ